MKKIFIILLFIIFNSTFSLANNSKKITPKDVDIFVKTKFENFRERISKEESERRKKNNERGIWFTKTKENTKRRKTITKEVDFQKRLESRLIAKCAYSNGYLGYSDECMAKVIRSVMSYSEKSKKRRPGDLFYVLDIIDSNNDPDAPRNWNQFIRYNSYVEGEKKPKNLPGMECKGGWYSYTDKNKERFTCISYNKTFYKKFEKFKKNPSKENLLGLKRVKYLKRLKMIKDIREKLGIPLWQYSDGSQLPDFARIAYPLLGDVLNSVVVDVKKNNVNPHLKQRRLLLEKYSLILSKLKKKLDEEDYKSIDKDILNLTKTFKVLQELSTNENVFVNKVDSAIDIISKTNNHIQTTILKIKDDHQEKLLAQSLIFFMDTIVESILYEIPEKYYAVTKPLNKDLFHKIELKELEELVEKMVYTSNKIKSDKLTLSIDVINKKSQFLDPNNVIKKLEDIGIKNSSKRPFTEESAATIAKESIINNLDKDIIKQAKKFLQSMEKDNMSDLTKEISKVASEIASDPTIKSSVSIPAAERKYGGQSLKKLIAAGIIKR